MLKLFQVILHTKPYYFLFLNPLYLINFTNRDCLIRPLNPKITYYTCTTLGLLGNERSLQIWFSRPLNFLTLYKIRSYRIIMQKIGLK